MVEREIAPYETTDQEDLAEVEAKGRADRGEKERGVGTGSGCWRERGVEEEW